MRIPIFVSCPTTLNRTQQASRRIILNELERFELEPRALGRSDYPTELPLREVFVIAKQCSGGVILGFEQFQALEGIWKRDTGKKNEKKIDAPIIFPTEWNNLEAGILFSLGLPLLVFKEEGINGGVFDPGVSDVFIHKMPVSASQKRSVSSVFLKWQSSVRSHYYNK